MGAIFLDLTLDSDEEGPTADAQQPQTATATAKTRHARTQPPAAAATDGSCKESSRAPCSPQPTKVPGTTQDGDAGTSKGSSKAPISKVPGATQLGDDGARKGRAEAPVAEAGASGPVAGERQAAEVAEAGHAQASTHLMPQTGHPALQGKPPGRGLDPGRHPKGNDGSDLSKPCASTSLARLGRSGHVLSQANWEQPSTNSTPRIAGSQLPAGAARPKFPRTVGEKNLLAAMDRLTPAAPTGDALRSINPPGGAGQGLRSRAGGLGQGSAPPASGVPQGFAPPYHPQDQPTTGVTQGSAAPFSPQPQQEVTGVPQGFVNPFPSLNQPHISALGLWRHSNPTAVAHFGKPEGSGARSLKAKLGVRPSSGVQGAKGRPQRRGTNTPVGSLQGTLEIPPSLSVQRATSSQERRATSLMQGVAGPRIRSSGVATHGSPAKPVAASMAQAAVDRLQAVPTPFLPSNHMPSVPAHTPSPRLQPAILPPGSIWLENLGSSGVATHASPANLVASSTRQAAPDRLQAATSRFPPSNQMPSIPPHTPSPPLRPSAILRPGSIWLEGGQVLPEPAKQANMHIAGESARVTAPVLPVAQRKPGAAAQVQHSPTPAGRRQPFGPGVHLFSGSLSTAGEPAPATLRGGRFSHTPRAANASVGGVAARGAGKGASPFRPQDQACTAAIQLEALARAEGIRLEASREAICNSLADVEKDRWRYRWMLTLVLLHAGPKGCLASELPLLAQGHGMTMPEFPAPQLQRQFPGKTLSTLHLCHPIYKRPKPGDGTAAQPQDNAVRHSSSGTSAHPAVSHIPVAKPMTAPMAVGQALATELPAIPPLPISLPSLGGPTGGPAGQPMAGTLPLCRPLLGRATGGPAGQPMAVSLSLSLPSMGGANGGPGGQSMQANPMGPEPTAAKRLASPEHSPAEVINVSDSEDEDGQNVGPPAPNAAVSVQAQQDARACSAASPSRPSWLRTTQTQGPGSSPNRLAGTQKSPDKLPARTWPCEPAVVQGQGESRQTRVRGRRSRRTGSGHRVVARHRVAHAAEPAQPGYLSSHYTELREAGGENGTLAQARLVCGESVETPGQRSGLPSSSIGNAPARDGLSVRTPGAGGRTPVPSMSAHTFSAAPLSTAPRQTPAEPQGMPQGDVGRSTSPGQAREERKASSRAAPELGQLMPPEEYATAFSGARPLSISNPECSTVRLPSGNAVQMPIPDGMQVLPGSPKVGLPGHESAADRLPVDAVGDAVEKPCGMLSAFDLIKLRQRGVAQPPQQFSRPPSPAPRKRRKTQTPDHVRNPRHVKVAELCRTLPNLPPPAEVPPRPDPYHECYPCGSLPAGSSRFKPFPGGHPGSLPQSTTTSCSRDATPGPSAGREDGPLRQKTSVTSVAGPVGRTSVSRLVSVREGQISPGQGPEGPGEGRPSAGGPGPCGPEISVSNPDAQTGGTALVDHPGHARANAQGIMPAGLGALRPAAGISDKRGKPDGLSAMPPPPEDVIRKPAQVAGCNGKKFEARANPSLSVSLIQYAGGPKDVSTGQGTALVEGNTPAIGTGEPPGYPAHDLQPLPLSKEGGGPGEGEAVHLTGSKEAPDLLLAKAMQTREPAAMEGEIARLTVSKEASDLRLAEATQKRERAAVAGAHQGKASRDLSTCNRPQVSGSQGNETGNPEGRPVPNWKTGEPAGGSSKFLDERERDLCGSPPAGPMRDKELAPGGDPSLGRPPQSTTTCSGDAAAKPRLERGNMPLRQKPSGTSVARPLPLGMGGSSLRPPGIRVGPGPLPSRPFQRIPDARPGVSALADRPGREPVDDAKGLAPVAPKAHAPFGLFAKEHVSAEPKAPSGRMTNDAGRLTKLGGLLPMPPPPKGVVRKAAPVMGRTANQSNVPANPSLSVSLVNYGTGAQDDRTGQATAPAVPTLGTGEPRGRAVPSHQSLSSGKDGRGSGGGEPVDSSGAEEAPALLPAEAAQQERAGVAGATHMEATHDLSASIRPPASGSQEKDTGNRIGRPAEKWKADELDDVPLKFLRKVLMWRGSAPTQSISRSTDPSNANCLRGQSSSRGPRLPANRVLPKAQYTGRVAHALSPPLRGVAKGKASEKKPGVTGRETTSPAILLGRNGSGVGSGAVLDRAQVGTGATLHSRQEARGESDTAGAVPRENARADGASASPRLGADPPRHRFTSGNPSNRRVGGDPPSGVKSPGSSSLPVSIKTGAVPSRLPRDPGALPSSPSQPRKAVPAKHAAAPALPSARKGLTQSAEPIAFPSSQKNLTPSVQPAAEAVETSENDTSTQVWGGGQGVANPLAEGPRTWGTAGEPARAADACGGAKGDEAPCEEVEQGMPSRKLRRLRKASEMGNFNQLTQMGGGGTGRGQEMLSPHKGTCCRRDAPDSPDGVLRDNEADVPSHQPVQESYESDEVVPLTYDVFQRLYMTRGYITMLTKTLSASGTEIEETFLKAVKYRFVRRLEGPKVPGRPPRYRLRMVVDAKWPCGEREKPVLILEDNTLQKLEGLSDKPAEDVWGLPEVAPLWHSTESRGRGLPDSAVPLTSAAVEEACFWSRICVNWADTLQNCSLDEDLKASRMQALCRSFKDGAQLPQQVLQNQEWRVPRPSSQFSEQADALMAILKRVPAPCIRRPSCTPSLDRDGGAASPLGLHFPESNAAEGEVVHAPVPKPMAIPDHPPGLTPTPPSSPRPQRRDTPPAKSEPRPDVRQEAVKLVRIDHVPLESFLDSVAEESPGDRATHEDRAKMKAAWQKIIRPYAPDPSHELEEEVLSQCPALQRRTTMEDPLLLGKSEQFGLDHSLLFPLDHGMWEEARAYTDWETAKRKQEHLPLDHGTYDEPCASWDRGMADRDKREEFNRPGWNGARGASLPQGTRRRERSQSPASGRGSSPRKRIRRTHVQDLPFTRRSPSGSAASRERALRRHYSAERARRRSGSPETFRDRKRGREERRRSKSRGRQRAWSSSPETYARQKKRSDAKRRGKSPPHKSEGVRKPGHDCRRAKPGSTSGDLDSRCGRSHSRSGRQKDGRGDEKRRGTCSSREPRRDRTWHDRGTGWSKPSDNRQRSLILSREGGRRDCITDDRSRHRHSRSTDLDRRGSRGGSRDVLPRSTDLDRRGSYASEPSHVKQRSPQKPSPHVTDTSVDMSIDEDVPDSATRPMSQPCQDWGKAIQDAATSGGNTLPARGEQAYLPPPPPLPARGEQAYLPPPPPLPASALRPPPLLIDLPPHLLHLRGIGGAMTAVPQVCSQNLADPGDTQPTPTPRSSGAEAQMVSMKGDLAFPLADNANTVAPDIRSGTATAPPISVADDVNSGVEARQVSLKGDPALPLADNGNTAASDPRSSTEAEPPILVADNVRSGVEAHQVSPNGDPALRLADNGNTAAPDPRSGTEAEPPIPVADVAAACPPLYPSGKQCPGPADLGGQPPPSLGKNPVGGDALPLPFAPEPGAEGSAVRAPCSEAGAQPGGADLEPQVAEDSSTWLHSPLLTQPAPSPPTRRTDVDVAAAAAPENRNAGGVAQVASEQQTPDASTQWPEDTGEGYSYPSGDAGWDDYCYRYYCYYGCFPPSSHATSGYHLSTPQGEPARPAPAAAEAIPGALWHPTSNIPSPTAPASQLPPAPRPGGDVPPSVSWQAHPCPPAHANTYAAPAYPPSTAHPYPPAGEYPGYYYHQGQWYPTSHYYLPPAQWGAASFYSAAPHVAAPYAGTELAPSQPAALAEGQSPSPGEPLSPTLTDVPAASAGEPIVKDEPTQLGMVGVEAEGADSEEDEYPPGVPRPETHCSEE